MSEQQLAQSASLLDNSGQQLLPNTRGELVWVKLASSRVVSSYSPEFEPTPDAVDGTAHLSWVLARTPRLDLANTFEILDIKLKSGNSVLPIASMTAADGLAFGSAASPIAAIKRYVSGTDKTYVGGNEISMIDASGIHSQRGVSAMGICDLTIAGGGGGSGTVKSLVFGGTEHTPSSDGVITVADTEFIASFGGVSGAVTLRGGQTANGSVNLAMSGQQLQASIVGLGTAAYKAESYFVAANTAITGATKCKITYDSKGLVTGGADLTESDIPSLSAGKITSGTFSGARIPIATADTNGGIRVGYTTSGNNYALQLDATTHKAYVSVPVHNPSLTIAFNKNQGQTDILTFNANGTENKKFGIISGGGIGLSKDSDGYLVITNSITALSQLSQDATHRLITDNEKTKWNSAIYGVKIATTSLTPEDGIITIPYATGSVAGAVSTSTQTFGGDKTFNGNIFGMKGVSAQGICDLSMAGGGGGSGTVTAVRLATGSTPINPDTDGIVTLSVYSISQVGALLEGKADASRVATIESKIPDAAASDNQLADKAFVNSSITTNTATFRGTSAANLTETQFLAWANGLTHDNNDYVFWNTKDSENNPQFKRYKYNGTSWEYEYTLNNSSFTAAQWAAINSGATSTVITSIAGKEASSNKVTAWNNPTDTQYPSAKLVKDSLDGKQGTLPTTGAITGTYAINILGDAATLGSHDADYFATAAQIELASVVLQSLQSQIDSVASRNHFDELIVTSLFADTLVGVDMYGTLHGNADTATKLATARTITIGNKSNTFDGSGNISFAISDIGAKQLQQAVTITNSTSTKTLTKITQNTNGEITNVEFTDIPTATNGQKGLIALGYAIPASDANHLHAPLNIDTNGKGYTLSQMGYKANNVVFEPTPNFA